MNPVRIEADAAHHHHGEGRMSTGYTGHGPSGGIQRHSMGGMFPYTVIAKGDPNRSLDWHAMDLRTGNEGVARRTYKEAEIDVFALKLRNMQHA